jgi:hypothetical protein
MNHRGPLLDEFNKAGRHYKWPDARMKLLFPKIVSDKWKSFLQKYMYPEDVVKQICQKFFSDSRVRINIDAINIYKTFANIFGQNIF